MQRDAIKTFTALVFFLNSIRNCVFLFSSTSKTIEQSQDVWHMQNSQYYQETYEVAVNGSKSLAYLPKFWRSTGLCPPDPHQDSYKFFSSEDVNLNFVLIGALPYNGITHVRIHWLLTLVEMEMNADGNIIYDFVKLDDLVHKLWINGLYLGFELMGNPSNMFSDFENSTQVYLWRDMVRSLAEHYLGLYGSKYVSKWRFETWNEPDHHDFDGLNFTIQGFLNYYDACSEGLKSASHLLKFGGPGGSCHVNSKSPICWALLKHSVSGKNFFTAETGVRLDFISFHKKGNGSSEQILEEEVETIEYIKRYFPTLSHVPVYNDEADPLKNWSLCKLWRSDATYAAFIIKVINLHIHHFILQSKDASSQKTNFQLLSNDNAFLSYFPCQFTERTLLARLQINNTVPSHVQFVRKPVYGAMGLLSKSCDRLLDLKIFKGAKKYSSNNFGAFATFCKNDRNRITVILYDSEDTNYTTGSSYVKITMKHMFFNTQDVRWAIYNINNIQTNPYRRWVKLGYPAFPTNAQLKYIKDQEEPYLDTVGVLNSSLSWMFHVKIQKPGISFLEICAKHQAPVMVKHVHAWKISDSAVQIAWKDTRNRCILTYKIEFSTSRHGPFKLLNDKYVSFPSFWHSCSNCTISGFYRVKAVNYWKVPGPYSKLTRCCSG